MRVHLSKHSLRTKLLISAPRDGTPSAVSTTRAAIAIAPAAGTATMEVAFSTGNLILTHGPMRARGSRSFPDTHLRNRGRNVGRVCAFRQVEYLLVGSLTRLFHPACLSLSSRLFPVASAAFTEQEPLYSSP